MDFYAQFMEIFALLTPEQQADLLEAAKLMVDNRQNPPAIGGADGERAD